VHACCQAFRWLLSTCTALWGLRAGHNKGQAVGRRCLVCKGRDIQCKLGSACSYRTLAGTGVRGFLPRLACCVMDLCKTSRQPNISAQHIETCTGGRDRTVRLCGLLVPVLDFWCLVEVAEFGQHMLAQGHGLFRWKLNHRGDH
jgi:hypothetical protein